MTNNWIRITGAIVLEFLVAGLVLGLLAMGDLASVVLDSYVLSMMFAAVLGVLLSLVIILYAHRLGGVPLRAFAFAWNQHHAPFALLVWLLTLGIASAYMWLLDQLGVREVLPLTPQWGVILVGILGSLGTIHEEVLSRGYIMPMLHRGFSIPAVLLISAVIFTLIHIPTRGVSFMLVIWLLSGLSFGYLYLKSGSLWSVLALHSVHNFAADLFLYSDNGIALVNFTSALGPRERVPFEVLLTLAVLGLTYLWYGRGTPLLAPSPDLLQRWEQRPEEHVNVVPKLT